MEKEVEKIEPNKADLSKSDLNKAGSVFSKKRPSRSFGFTLVELMVVVSIISLLTSVALAGIQEARNKARDVTIHSNLRSFVTQLEIAGVNSFDDCEANNLESLVALDDHAGLIITEVFRLMGGSDAKITCSEDELRIGLTTLWYADDHERGGWCVHLDTGNTFHTPDSIEDCTDD